MSKYRGGLVPERSNEQPFKPVTTQDVERYIRNKFNSINYMMRKKGIDVEDVHVELKTITPGKEFCPFLAFFSTNIDKGWNDRYNKNNNGNFEDIFEDTYVEDEDDFYKAQLIPEYYNLIHDFAYDKQDIKFMMQPGFINKMKIPGKYMIKQIARFRNPVISRKNDTIMVVLDPVRIFFDMAKDENYNPNVEPDWHIDIVHKQKIKDGEFRYKFIRVQNEKRKGKKNKHNSNSFEANMARSLSCGR